MRTIAVSSGTLRKKRNKRRIKKVNEIDKIVP